MYARFFRLLACKMAPMLGRGVRGVDDWVCLSEWGRLERVTRL